MNTTTTPTRWLWTAALLLPVAACGGSGGGGSDVVAPTDVAAGDTAADMSVVDTSVEDAVTDTSIEDTVADTNVEDAVADSNLEDAVADTSTIDTSVTDTTDEDTSQPESISVPYVFYLFQRGTGGGTQVHTEFWADAIPAAQAAQVTRTDAIETLTCTRGSFGYQIYVATTGRAAVFSVDLPFDAPERARLVAAAEQFSVRNASGGSGFIVSGFPFNCTFQTSRAVDGGAQLMVLDISCGTTSGSVNENFNGRLVFDPATECTAYSPGNKFCREVDALVPLQCDEFPGAVCDLISGCSATSVCEPAVCEQNLNAAACDAADGCTWYEDADGSECGPEAGFVGCEVSVADCAAAPGCVVGATCSGTAACSELNDNPGGCNHTSTCVNDIGLATGG